MTGPQIDLAEPLSHTHCISAHLLGPVSTTGVSRFAMVEYLLPPPSTTQKYLVPSASRFALSAVFTRFSCHIFLKELWDGESNVYCTQSCSISTLLQKPIKNCILESRAPHNAHSRYLQLRESMLPKNMRFDSNTPYNCLLLFYISPLFLSHLYPLLLPSSEWTVYKQIQNS